ncbi:MAG: hypothetical protein KAR40_07605 [Candidatus Sabulitectum sp.]|nr:hypothetical protein [Candidatus Sabulitectum sp.]
MKTAAVMILLVACMAFGDSNVHVWGDNAYGQCDVPDEQFYGVYSGVYANHVIAMDGDGGLIAWGDNSHGQCNIPSSTGVLGASASKEFSVFITNGAVETCGTGYNPGGESQYPSPFVKVSAGGFHILGLRGNGDVEAWGGNAVGQCDLPIGYTYKEISAGRSHTLAVTVNGYLRGCGYDQFGQASPPTGKYIAVAAGFTHSVAIAEDSTIVAWGNNNYGQVSDAPSSIFKFVAIAAGDNHCIGLRANGMVVAWGRDNEGQCTIPAGLTGVISIAAGRDFSVALTEVVSSIEGACVEEAGVGFGVTSPFGSTAYNSAPEGSYVTVFDMTGRKVGKTQNNVWDSGSAPAGVYVFVLNNGVSSAMAVKL